MQTYKSIWEAVLREMRSEFSDIKIKSWFEDISIVEIESQYIILMTATSATLDFVRSERRNLERFISAVLGEFKIVYVYAADRDLPQLSQIREDINEDLVNPQQGQTPYHLAEERYKVQKEALSGADLSRAEILSEAGEPKYIEIDSAGDTKEKPEQKPVPNAATRKNEEYTFDSFVAGSSNRFVYNACLAVASNPSTAWNPLFVYGPSGVGKTHLLYAITNELRSHDPDMKIIYVKGEEFTNQMIASLRTKDGPASFREKYRTVDVLLVDDIQFIAGKVGVQEEFFHTFNALYEDRKQIILTSDKPPREIKTLEERLQTRFEMGLTADIQPPDYELRVAIILNKAQVYKLQLPQDAVVYLAENLVNNIRQIEGALKRIYARSVLYDVPVTLSMVKKSVADLITVAETPEETADRIISAVSKKYNVSTDDLKSKAKTKEVVEARHIAVYLIRKVVRLPLKQIGGIFNRDHSTIMNSVNVVDARIMSDPVYEREINDIIAQVR